MPPITDRVYTAQPAVVAEIAPTVEPGAHQATYFAQVMADQPALYYRLQEIDAVPGAVDASRSAYNGSYGGVGTTFNQGSPITGDTTARSINAAGTGNPITIASTSLMDFDVGSLECWFYTGTVSQTGALLERTIGGGSNTAMLMFLDTTGLRVRVKPSGAYWDTTYASSNFAANTWYHVVGTFDGFVIRCYVNGAQVATLDFGTYTSMARGAGLLTVGFLNGGGTPTYRFNGNIAEPAFYPHALPADRVKAHYDARTTAAPAVTDPDLWQWANVTRQLRQLSTRRGRKGTLERVEVGTAGAALENTDRRFEPEYAGEPGNLIPNPSAETNASGWVSVANATIARSTAVFLEGTGVILHTSTVAGNSQTAPVNLDSTNIAVTVGRTYTGSVYARGGSGSTTRRLYLQWFDSGGAEITASRVTGSTYSAPGGVWTRASVTGVAPAGAVRARLLLEITSAAVNDYGYWDAALFEEAATASRYYDGDSDNARWSGTRHASVTYKGGPYSPNLRPLTPFRARAVYPPNLIRDANFERADITSAARDWTYVITAAGAPTFPTGVGIDGANLRVIQGTIETGTYILLSSIKLLPVDVSMPYVLSGYFRRTAGASNAQTALRLECFDDRGISLGQVYPNVAASGITWATGHFDPGTSWTRWGGMYAGEDGRNGLSGTSSGGFMRGTKYVKVHMYLAYQPTAGTVTVQADALQLTPGSTPLAATETGCDARTTLGGGTAYDNYYPLFLGFVEGWPQMSPSHRRGRVELNAVDLLEQFAQTEFVATMPSETAGKRMHRALDAGGIPDARRIVDTGAATVGAYDSDDGALNPFGHAQDVATTEFGQFFAAADGRAIFQSRNARAADPYTTSRGTFGDGGPLLGELPYVGDPKPVYDVERIVNEVAVTRTGGVEQVATNQTSIKRYGRRRLPLTILAASDAGALDIANYIVSQRAEPLYEFTQVELEVRRAPGLAAQAVARELSDRITIIRRPQGTGYQLKEVFIESISHDIQAEDERFVWRTRFEVSAGTSGGGWILGTSALDVDAKLAF